MSLSSEDPAVPSSHPRGIRLLWQADTEAMLMSDDTWTRIIGAWVMCVRAILGGLAFGALFMSILCAVLLWMGALR